MFKSLLREKHQKNETKKCKQERSFLFNFLNIFVVSCLRNQQSSQCIRKAESFLKSNFDLNQICKIMLTKSLYICKFSATEFFYSGRSTIVGQRPLKSLSSACLSICPSVCPSLNFRKTGPLVFSDIVHGDSWPRYLVTDETRFLEKKIGGPNLRLTDLIHVQNEVFRYFL